MTDCATAADGTTRNASTATAIRIGAEPNTKLLVVSAGGGNRCRWREPKARAANRMSAHGAPTSEWNERVECRGRESNPHEGITLSGF